jgi:hypothetical protein
VARELAYFATSAGIRAYDVSDTSAPALLPAVAAADRRSGVRRGESQVLGALTILVASALALAGCPDPDEDDCTDGVDNDSDERTDCEDVDCELDPACPARVETTCDDGIDGDVDGVTDCDDTDCVASDVCVVAASRAPAAVVLGCGASTPNGDLPGDRSGVRGGRARANRACRMRTR